MAKYSPKNSGKYGSTCRTVNLSKYLNWPQGKRPGDEWWRDLVAKVEKNPKGLQKPGGVPFQLASAGKKRVILLRKGDAELRVPIGGQADYICILHEWRQLPVDVHWDQPQAGLVIGEYELVYADGTSHVQPIRTRFELTSQEGCADAWCGITYPMPNAMDAAQTPPSHSWGYQQTGVGPGAGQSLVLCPLPNPHPDKKLRALLIRCFTESPLLVAGLTLYRGADNPLRLLPRRAYRVRKQGKPARVKTAEVDLGLVVRIERPQEPRGKKWLESQEKGKVVPAYPAWLPRSEDADDIVEIAGATDARVTVELEGVAKPLSFSLGEAFNSGNSSSGSAVLEVLGRRRQWMTVRVIDGSTGRPTPTRVHFSGPSGEYIPPYGHHQQINYNWFEDYGADVVAGGQSFAYVPGEFTTDMPVGDVYVDIFKGFEYEPIRMKTRIAAGQQTLELRINRALDLRSRGWVTADTHVHFLSPQTAWLQAQCEGVNVVNLLASQWGRLFTNVGDLAGRVGVVEDDTIVYVGTENRNHMLGHMSMLGTQGLPVFPMCCGGPHEAWFGDPDFMTLAEWAAQNRRQRGVVIRPHFPYCGNTEDPVPILMGLVDALEVSQDAATAFPTQEWYRYLNSGYRVAVCGGTDKMCAAQPLGWQRTYALIDPQREFSYDAWAGAVRAGRTFATSGPVIDLLVEGRGIGDTIEVSSGVSELEIHAAAQYYVPLGKLEIILNGNVVACAESPKGSGQLELHEKVRVSGCGWIAARCSALPTHPCSYATAHTSPIYLKRGSDRLYNGPAIEHMLSHVEGGIEYLEKLATTFDESSRKRMVKLFNEARSELLNRMEKEGGHKPHHGGGLYHVHGDGTPGHRH